MYCNNGYRGRVKRRTLSTVDRRPVMVHRFGATLTVGRFELVQQGLLIYLGPIHISEI